MDAVDRQRSMLRLGSAIFLQLAFLGVEKRIKFPMLWGKKHNGTSSKCKNQNRRRKNPNQITQEVKQERFLIWSRQNNVQTFGKCCLRESDERSSRYKTRNVGNTEVIMSLLHIVGGQKQPTLATDRVWK